MAAMVLMAAVVLPLPQGAMMRLNASETKLDASSMSYRNLEFFIEYSIASGLDLDEVLSLISHLNYNPEF